MNRIISQTNMFNLSKCKLRVFTGELAIREDGPGGRCLADTGGIPLKAVNKDIVGVILDMERNGDGRGVCEAVVVGWRGWGLAVLRRLWGVFRRRNNDNVRGCGVCWPRDFWSFVDADAALAGNAAPWAGFCIAW